VRTLDEINTDLAGARERRDTIRDDIDRIFATKGDGSLDDGRAERVGNLSKGLENANGEVESLEDEWRSAMEEGIRTGELTTDPAEPSYDRRSVSHDLGDPRLRGVRDRALGAIERHAEFSSTEATERIENVVRRRDPNGIIARYLAAVGDPNYASAFSKMLGDPAMAHLKFSSREVEAVRTVTAVESERAMSTTTTGVPVPYQLDPTLIYAGSGALNPFRQICRVETVTEGTWKGVNTTDVTLAYSAEAAESADNSPTLAQPTITTQRVLGFIPFSIELSQDWGAVVPELTAALSDGKDILDATAFLTGTGTNQPGGVLNIGGTGGLTTTQRVLTTTTAVYALADPYLLKAGLPARFINNSTYVAAPGVWDITYRFVGGNSTEPFQMPTRGGEMLGRPKVELSTMSTTVGTTGQKIMMLGDFKTGYLIADRLGMQVELIPHLVGSGSRFPTGQRGLVAIWRTGGGVVAANALRYLEVK
jgi:HK97 family phage major capsid protein